MKKIMYLTALVIICCLLGCSGMKDDKTNSQNQSANQVPSQSEKTNIMSEDTAKNSSAKHSSPAKNSTAKTKTEKKQVSDMPDLEEPKRPNLTLSQKGIKLRWINDGKLHMSASASELVGNEVGKCIEVRNFKGELYEKGTLTSKISAKRAFIDANTRIVTATGGVTMNSVTRKTSVRSEWVKWYSKENRVVGDGGVKITSQMGTIDAAAFTADTSLGKLVVKDSGKGL